ncbi:MAG: adenylate kinase [Bifidobacteriaceae bacterium]|jgi:adenylate kinase|nr:adenylate kinase [Bifidobacteriaceae bacterium]
MSRNYVIIGPQGSGKGTQAKILSDKLGIAHVSTGEILRENVKNATEAGKKVEAIINRGDLVPDDLIAELLADRLLADDAVRGFILDGYPRNSAQFEKLRSILEEKGTELDAVIVLDVDENELLDRMELRAKKEGRKDDTPDAVKKRLAIYANETHPIIAKFEEQGNVLRIQAVGEIDEINEEIIRSL